jgi:hypothetical protein
VEIEDLVMLAREVDNSRVANFRTRSIFQLHEGKERVVINRNNEEAGIR